MGFFDFLKKPKEEEKAKPAGREKPVEVEMGSLEKRINEHISDRLSRDQEKAKDLYAKIKSDFREIKRMNSELSKKKFEEGERLYSAVNMIKNNYVNRVYGLLGGVPLVRGTDFEELENFCSKTNNILDKMRNTPPKQAILLSKYFKKEAAQIVKILKNIENELGEMKSLISNGSPLSFVSSITSQAGMIMDMKKKFAHLEREESMLREKKGKTEAERKKKEAELKKLLESERYRELVEGRKKMGELMKEKERLENEIREEFSSIKRPLKKYEHVLGRASLPREQRIAFEKLIHSPVKAVLSERGEDILREVVSRTGEAVKNKEISLKESELKKFTEFTEKVKSGRIAELKKKYREIREEIRERGKKKETPMGEEEKIKREIEHLNHEIREYERNLEGISRSKESTKAEILEEREKLEKMIERGTGRKFRVKLF